MNCQTIISSGEICNLPESLHDGRELDLLGYLHRFNQPINPDREKKTEVYDDVQIEQILPPSNAMRVLLTDLYKFLNNQIIRMAQNGAKFPGLDFVNQACRLSSAISQHIEVEVEMTYQNSAAPNVLPAINSQEQRRLETLRKKYRKVR